MKRFCLLLSILLFTLLCTSACFAESSDAELMAKIVAANNGNQIVQQYGSVQVEYTVEDGSMCAEYDAEYTMYADAELLYIADSAHEQITLPDGTEYQYVPSNGIFAMNVYLDGAPVPYDMTQMLISASSREESVANVEIADGTTCITTVMTGEELRQRNPGYNFRSDIEQATGVYTVDTNTLRLSKIEFEYVLADGSIGHNTTIVTCPAQRPEMAQTLLEHVNSKDVRHCVFVIEPGSEEQQTIEVDVQKGDYVSTYANASVTMYDDAECTVPHTASDPSMDMTVYIKFGS